MISKKIIEKYNLPSPRYTSYPTILDWNQKDICPTLFKSNLKQTFLENQLENVSVYIHLPYCESLCTFCGCHKHITKNHKVEEPYIDALLKEWDLYNDLTSSKFQVEELHLGGGTPTFFSVKQLERLLQKITLYQASNPNYSLEGHPNHTSEEQMILFFDYGFRRISFGVQDYDPVVQKAINRVQTFDQVKKVTEQARKIGFTSISHDLVFGLPFQTLAAIQQSISLTIELRPDNISLYSYAHVPWVKGTGQRGFSEDDIPNGDDKKALYDFAKNELLKADYLEIGMDHFGLPTEPMTIAMQEKKLNRNFMGYTTAKTERLIGLGVSAISEYPFGYAQNIKSTKEYLERISTNEFPVFKGHIHSPLDQHLKEHIKSLMCNFETTYTEGSWLEKQFSELNKQFESFEADGIIKWQKNKRTISITDDGRPFVRNVCMQLDPYAKNKSDQPRFSKTV